LDRSLKRRGRRPAAGDTAAKTQVAIESIAGGGEGVGRLPDGRAVFVHRTAPGDTVEISILRDRPRWARGKLLRVLQPSTQRRPPPCPHYDECGGCTLEHLRYDAQLEAKSRIVQDAMRRIGGLDVEAPEVTASPLTERYRNRVSFTLRRGGRGRVWAGFHSLHDPSRIVPVDGRCLLPEEPIAHVWDSLRQHWGVDANRLPAGESLRLTFRATGEGAVSLMIEGGFSEGRPAELLALVEGLASVWHRPDAAPPRHLAGSPGVPEVWGLERFELSGTAFLQVNRQAAALLEDHVLDLASADALPASVVDAYCGVGLHARRLARAGSAVTGIELDGEAVKIAREAGQPGLQFLEGRVEDLLPQALPADLLILNPPRAGVDSAVIDAVRSRPPARIIYVSCDPATLARDLKHLSEGYAVDRARCFDLFPQTSHVETVVLLTNKP
jgi:23S rRNA (uracil1939-C5)-methyltransferase